jgi:methylated-DNA-[protein]-cysteine S-methyltransferase
MKRLPDDLVYTYHESPIGRLLLAGDGEALHLISFPAGSRTAHPFRSWRRDDTCFGDVLAQIEAYFEGQLQDFNVPLALNGTAFQIAVWRMLREIPYGETVSYGAIAKRMGQPSAGRAIGAANGANPIPIIVPCHRVIGANGCLTGFGGGIETKKFLLKHECARRFQDTHL